MNFKYLKEFLDYQLPMLGIPGSDTSVYVGHEEVFRHTTGFDSIKEQTPLKPNALYNLYSCTKVATCVAATQLIRKNRKPRRNR